MIYNTLNIVRSVKIQLVVGVVRGNFEFATWVLQTEDYILESNVTNSLVSSIISSEYVYLGNFE